MFDWPWPHLDHIVRPAADDTGQSPYFVLSVARKYNLSPDFLLPISTVSVSSIIRLVSTKSGVCYSSREENDNQLEDNCFSRTEVFFKIRDTSEHCRWVLHPAHLDDRLLVCANVSNGTHNNKQRERFGRIHHFPPGKINEKKNCLFIHGYEIPLQNTKK